MSKIWKKKLSDENDRKYIRCLVCMWFCVFVLSTLGVELHQLLSSATDKVRDCYIHTALLAAEVMYQAFVIC